MDRAAYVAFARRRLCLGPERDADVDAALGADPALAVTSLISLTWSPPAGLSPRRRMLSSTG